MYNGRRLAKPNQGTIEIRLSRHQTISPQTKSPPRTRLAANNAVTVRDMTTKILGTETLQSFLALARIRPQHD